MIKLYNGDTLKIMDRLIADGIKVDAIITDPPYGTTACKWDSILPFNEMWPRLEKLSKNHVPIILFGSQPFTSMLIHSNVKNFKYEWIWEKPNGTNAMLAKHQPMKNHENILVFNSSGSGRSVYNPQMTEGKPYTWESKRSKGSANGYDALKEDPKIVNKGERFPKSVQKFKQERGMHPTQKPLNLMIYLVETYTNENDLVLDFTMGSGTTMLACKHTDRRGIGIELDEKYFEIAKKRTETIIFT